MTLSPGGKIRTCFRFFDLFFGFCFNLYRFCLDSCFRHNGLFNHNAIYFLYLAYLYYIKSNHLA